MMNHSELFNLSAKKAALNVTMETEMKNELYDTINRLTDFMHRAAHEADKMDHALFRIKVIDQKLETNLKNYESLRERLEKILASAERLAGTSTDPANPEKLIRDTKEDIKKVSARILETQQMLEQDRNDIARCSANAAYLKKSLEDAPRLRDLLAGLIPVKDPEAASQNRSAEEIRAILQEIQEMLSNCDSILDIGDAAESCALSQ